jgi:hypothetical protein
MPVIGVFSCLGTLDLPVLIHSGPFLQEDGTWQPTTDVCGSEAITQYTIGGSKALEGQTYLQNIQIRQIYLPSVQMYFCPKGYKFIARGSN